MDRRILSCFSVVLLSGCLEYKLSTTPEHHYPAALLGIWEGDSRDHILEFRQVRGCLKLEVYDVGLDGPWTRAQVNDSDLYSTVIADQNFIDFRDEDGYFHTVRINFIGTDQIRLDPIVDSVVKAAGVSSDMEFRRFVSDNLGATDLFTAGDTLRRIPRTRLLDRLVDRPMKPAIDGRALVAVGLFALVGAALTPREVIGYDNMHRPIYRDDNYRPWDGTYFNQP